MSIGLKKDPAGDLNQRIKVKQAEFQNIVNQAKEIEKSVSDAKRQGNRLQTKIDEEQRRIEENTKEKREAQEKVVRDLERECGKLEEAHNKLKSEKDKLEQQVAANREEAENFQTRSNEYKDTIRILEKQFSDLRRQKENNLRSYGDKIPEILAAIEKQGNKFNHPVVGPIGRHIKLKDKKWSKAMNSIIGGSLNQFMVQDFHDYNALLQILKAHNSQNPIVVRRGNTCPGVSQAMPDRKFTRVLDILEIDEACVKALLIDTRQVEKIILIEKYDEARRVMFHDKPRNADTCYTLEAEQLTSKGGSSMYFAITAGGRGHFFDDINQQIADTEHQIEEQKSLLQTLTRDNKAILDGLKQKERDLENMKKQLMQQQNGLNRKKKDLLEAKDQIQQERPSNIGALESEKQKIDEEINLLSIQYQELVSKADSVKAEITPLKTSLKAIDAESKALQDTIVELQNAQEKLMINVQTINGHKAQLLKVRGDLETKINELKDEVNEQKARVAEMIELARTVCAERVPVTKPPKQLDAELKKLGQSITEKEKEFGKAEVVEREFEQKNNDYLEVKKSINNNVRLLKRIHAALSERVSRWYEYRKYIAIRAKFMFIQSLQHRGYSGQIKFNHQEQKLALVVQTKDSTATRDTKQLSGGERSFSTVSFLLALWEAMECPFRALDEFDVFMDAVNRRISTSMIIDVARATKNRQFILISPQDMSTIELADDVHIVRLEAPERNTNGSSSSK